MILLKISAVNIHFLNQIRHWHNLKVGKFGDTVWVTGLSEENASSTEVLSIPFISLYKVNDGFIFPLGSNLPEAKEPELLWSPISNVLPIELPPYNFNFFGVRENIQMKLIPSGELQETFATEIDLSVLTKYMEKAPAIRNKNLSWCLIEDDTALILGLPILPLPGKSYWRHGNSLIPGGYVYQYDLLAPVIENKINALKDAWIFWGSPSEYSLMYKDQLVPLNRSSVRLTSKHLNI